MSNYLKTIYTKQNSSKWIFFNEGDFWDASNALFLIWVVIWGVLFLILYQAFKLGLVSLFRLLYFNKKF